MGDEQRLTPEIAEKFLNDPDSVDLGAYPEIDDAAAEVLARYDGILYLGGPILLSDASAEAL